jgi:hypothetical protein
MVAVSKCDSPASSENTRMYSTGRGMACYGAGVVAGTSGDPAVDGTIGRHHSLDNQATIVARRRRCSIIASIPATSERALEPVVGSISGTPEGVAVAMIQPPAESTE